MWVATDFLDIVGSLSLDSRLVEYFTMSKSALQRAGSNEG